MNFILLQRMGSWEPVMAAMRTSRHLYTAKESTVKGHIILQLVSWKRFFQCKQHYLSRSTQVAWEPFSGNTRHLKEYFKMFYTPNNIHGIWTPTFWSFPWTLFEITFVNHFLFCSFFEWIFEFWSEQLLARGVRGPLWTIWMYYNNRYNRYSNITIDIVV